VKYEFIRMPNSNGFGEVIPVSFRGRRDSYTHCMFLNDEGPIAGGRELWGFPKKLAQPTLRTEIDTLVGTLDYEPLRVATGTMGYKHREADLAHVGASLAAPNFLLKIIPHVDGTPRICELVEYHLEDVTIKGAWTGPAALHLSPHAFGTRRRVARKLGRGPSLTALCRCFCTSTPTKYRAQTHWYAS
jgi:acetoacetate decarboxylase